MVGLTRVVRYLVTLPRMVMDFKWGPMDSNIFVYVDANWAGCMKTRKSTPGGTILIGGKYLKGLSKTMPVLALSTGESELAAVTKGISEGLGMQAIFRDFGHNVCVHVLSDTTAAICICRRQGLGHDASGKVAEYIMLEVWFPVLARVRGPPHHAW